MVLGDDAAMPEDLRDAFKAASLTHLTAASGQNIALLAALAFGLCVVAGVGIRARWTLVLVLIALYVPLAGGGPSIQRAGRHGRCDDRGRARRAARVALVRAAARRGGDTRPGPARRDRPRLAAELRGGDRDRDASRRPRASGCSAVGSRRRLPRPSR